MQLALDTLEELDRALRFLRRERHRVIRVVFRIGPVAEQSVAQPVRRPPADRSWGGILHATDCNEEADTMTLVLTDSQQAKASAAFKDKRGNAAQVEGVSWKSSDDTIVTVEQDAADPNSATIKATGAIGTAQVSVQADAKVGDGETLIVGTVDIQVVAGEAVTADISAGTPEEQA